MVTSSLRSPPSNLWDVEPPLPEMYVVVLVLRLPTRGWGVEWLYVEEELMLRERELPPPGNRKFCSHFPLISCSVRNRHNIATLAFQHLIMELALEYSLWRQSREGAPQQTKTAVAKKSLSFFQKKRHVFVSKNSNGISRLILPPIAALPKQYTNIKQGHLMASQSSNFNRTVLGWRWM